MNPRAASSPVVVALHSSGAGARQWAPYRTLLHAASRFVAPDLLGYDDATPWPVGRVASLQAEARRIADLIEGLGASPVHLVGHSYGGSVALQLALGWPQHVASLTLYEPVRFALLRGFDGDAWRDIVDAGRRIGAHALCGRLHESAEIFVDYWSGAGAWQRLGPTRQEAVAQRMPKVRAEFEALFDDRLSPSAYGRLGMPLHVVCGDSSPAPARSVAERLVRLAPRARLTRWTGADHMAPLTQAERFARLLPGALPLEHINPPSSARSPEPAGGRTADCESRASAAAARCQGAAPSASRRCARGSAASRFTAA